MRGVLVVLVSMMVPATGWSADENLVWPRFRGPNGSGVAEGQAPPTEFGPDRNVKWKVSVPSGLSSPIVAGDFLVLTAFEDDKLYTIAYRRTDGTEAWRAQAKADKLEPYHKTEGGPASSTSATDGEHIVSYFGSCGLVCYDLHGKELWKHEMPPAAVPGDFGSGVSPIIADGVVILVRDQIEGAKVIALSVEDGSPLWEKPRQSMASYGTPVVWNTPQGKQIAAPGHARMIGYDLKSGKEQWSLFGIPSGCCASPVAAGGLLLFAGTSTGATDEQPQMPTFDGLLKGLDKDNDGALSRAEAEKDFGGFFDNQDANKDGKVTRDEWDLIIKFLTEGKDTAFALKPGAKADVTESQFAWKLEKGLPYVASGIAYENQYVMVRDGGIVHAVDLKTGKRLYQERVAAAGKYYASPVAANGCIYFTALDDGAITVLKAGADKADVVASNPPLGERTAATPAIANDTLYVRTAESLYAFAEEK